MHPFRTKRQQVLTGLHQPGGDQAGEWLGMVMRRRQRGCQAIYRQEFGLLVQPVTQSQDGGVIGRITRAPHGGSQAKRGSRNKWMAW